jgi:uncharacterized protein YegP (UPF0339 family)
MINKILCASMVLAGLSVSSFAATAAAGFYVEQDAKTHACMISDKAPDGKAMMDVGTKVYASKANAEQAMANLKVCAAAMAPAAKPAAAATAAKPAAVPSKPAAAVKPAAMAAAGFYVEQDAKTHKCMVGDKAPDGKTMMDVGTKVYKTKPNAEMAMSMLKACK